MKDKKKYVLSVGLMALVIAITFYVLLKDNQIKTILPALKQVDLRFIGLGVLVMSLFPCCEAANIHAMLRSFGQKASYLSCVKYAYVGFYFSSITPSASRRAAGADVFYE